MEKVIEAIATVNTFAELPLSAEMLNTIEKIGYVTPSPIQSEAIPILLQGGDVIGQAQTGTGKTAAFSIPTLETLDMDDAGVQVLVMCPTRELAIQVAGEVKKLSAHIRGFNVLAVYGGDPIDKQMRALKGKVQWVVGTPGRIIDHLNRKTLKLNNIKTVILDEADEMLNMGFREDIEDILGYCPEDRQTVLFSATMAPPILQLAKKFQKNPSHVKVVKTELTNAKIEQFYMDVPNSERVEVMRSVMEEQNFKQMLIFCNTKRRVDEVTESLKTMGIKAEGLHGDLSQAQRNKAMQRFREEKLQVLVATDVAARGLDVENVEAVFNLELPLDIEFYVHRIGRTGRAGKEGKSISFVYGRQERSRLAELERYTKVRLTRKELPSPEVIREMKLASLIQKLQPWEKYFDENEFQPFIDNYLAEGKDMNQLIHGLFKLALGEDLPRPKRERSERHERDFDRDRGDRGDRGRSRERRNSRDGYSEKRDRFDRGDRKERTRRDKSPAKSGVPEKGYSRLFLTIGHKDQVTPRDIVGAIAGETGLPGKIVGSIDIYDKFTFVEVVSKDAEKVMKVMNGNEIKGRKVAVELSQKAEKSFS